MTEVERLRLALRIVLGLDDGSEPGYEEACREIERFKKETNDADDN